MKEALALRVKPLLVTLFFTCPAYTPHQSQEQA
jgi:hypothetical protein